MLPDVRYQVATKLETIRNIKNYKHYELITKKYNNLYKNYHPVYCIDIGIQKMPYTTALFYIKPEKNLIIYFSKHSLDCSYYRHIVELSKSGQDGYNYLTTDDDVTVVLYKPQIKEN